MSALARVDLGDFISMHCFKAVITGIEDILGPEGTASAMIAAGRKRGIAVVEQAGLKGSNPAPESLAGTMNGFFGKNGTCLCEVVSVTPGADGTYLVKTRQTVCTAAEPAGSQRTCTYTMGAVLGFFEATTGKVLVGQHVASILNGSATDDFLLKPLI